ncbi:hypothetical protein HanRHA438_Chr11g0530861 [Helianthus annuus]|nr:hypothetical protein HanRHA438_Chr11g0530861 [Helianthus annuus]
MGTLEDMIDPILKEETCENNFVLKRGPNKESLHTFMNIAYQCVAETQDQRPTMKVVVKELEKALSFQLNSEVKSDYVEEKSHASIIETQVVEISNELNNMNMTGESENFKIHNKESMLHDQTDDPAEPNCSGDMWVQESQDSQEGRYTFLAKYVRNKCTDMKRRLSCRFFWLLYSVGLSGQRFALKLVIFILVKFKQAGWILLDYFAYKLICLYK